MARRRWKVGLGIFTTILGLSALLVLTSRPIYRAEARLRLGEPPPMSGVSPNAGFFGLFQLGGDPFANDLELLLSRTLTEGVVRDASLNASIRAPAGWYRDSLFVEFQATPETDEATFEVAWEGETIRVRRTAPEDSLVGRFPIGAPAEFGGLRVVARPSRPDLPSEIQIRTVPFGEAVQLFPGRLVVERARREANVVGISFNGPDPGITRDVVASAIERFIELRTSIQRRESGQTVDSLRNVANETLAELNQAEVAMEDLQRRVQLIAPEAQNEAFIGRYSDAVGDLESARVELAGITRLLQRVDAAPDPVAGWADLAAYPAFLQNETAGELLTGLNRLNEERLALASRRAETSREYQVLTEQIERRNGAIRGLAVGYRTALRERIGDLELQVAGMERFLAGVPQQAIDLGRHQREVRILSEVLVLTEQRLRQEELRQALTFANVQVIDPPALEHEPVWPRKTLGLGVGFLLASVFGVLGMAVAERADRTVRRAREVSAITGRPVLAVTTVNGKGVVELAPAESRAVLGRSKEAPGGRGRVALVPTGDASAARALLAAVAAGAEAGVPGDCPPPFRIVEVDSFASAAVVDSPVVLAVVCGRTEREELQRVTEFLRQTGAELVGSLLICGHPGEAGHAWD